jgi:hypothetical protein
MKRRTKTNKFPLTHALITLGILLAAAVILLAFNPFKAEQKPEPQDIKGNTTNNAPAGNQDEITPSPTQAASTNTPAVVPVSKPILQKSSGNAPGSSVPAGAMLEFTCEGTANAQCEVVLTDKLNSSRYIALGRKTIASNSRGQYFAIWNWQAEKGSWRVEAKSSRNGAGITVSDSQSLEVK